MRRTTAFLLACVISLPLLAEKPPAAASDQALAMHVLNRAAFGARPGDVDHLLLIGPRKWIETQLTPGAGDTPALARRLERYSTLSASSATLWSKYYQPVLDRRREKKDATAKESMEKTAPARRRGAGRQVVIQELALAKLERAIHSDRQLEEIMVDFWMNHFNVFAGKAFERVLLTEFERDVIRPHVFGNFESLLLATAKSPAMLVYLDNAQSAASMENRPRRAAMRQMRKRASGLNENYARELLELHTLGVEGGYTQADVTELARLLTGWSIERGKDGVKFRFRPALHDTKPKKLLGFAFEGNGGINEAESIIRKLAVHPSTARHISMKLAQRFVSDDAPQALVDRAARRFVETRGNIRETLRTILLSDEFLSLQYASSKIKTPFEFVVSALRAVGAPEVELRPVLAALRQMGQPLYFAQPPTGYSELAEDWVSSGALVERLSFAHRVASATKPIDREANEIAVSVIGRPLSEKSREAIDKAIRAMPESKNLKLALVLGSPDFQRQ